ncbi:MAG: GAF domain-containing protein [Blastocatellia bacterium]|nr:GAF domain-containing protein [Blastocatellia bacterium]MCS7156796.1 GAF domain-containing protein [Blastocatellia bacterium]MCX7752754.1 GAF domain-containing protein [Blastocatellia bacterium]MDW8167487.1 GAF domain-containing protein [Acidobacteriota bacterium]MDW8256834.1 GAF domain-containing protein [Acidobacteriota bacterium]
MTSSLAHGDRLMHLATHERILQRMTEVLECTRQLAILNVAAAATSDICDLDALLQNALERLLELLSFEAGAIYLRESAPSRDADRAESSRALRLRLSRGIPPSFAELLERASVGEGPIADVAAAGEPLFLEVSTVEPLPYRHLIRRAGFHIFALIPLRAGDETIGVLLLASRTSSMPGVGERALSSTDALASGIRANILRDLPAEYRSAFSLALGNLLGTAIENARRYREMVKHVQRERHRVELWQRVGRLATTLLARSLQRIPREGGMIAPVSEDELLAEACRLIQEAFGLPNVSIFKLDESAEEIVLVATQSRYARPAPLGYRQSIYVGTLGWVARHGEALLANDVSIEPRFVRYHAETRAEFDLPIKVHGRLIGIVSIESDRPHAFTEDDVIALRWITDHLSWHVENTRFAEMLRRQLEHATESERLHRMVIEALGDGIAIIQDRRIRYANRRWTELVGLPAGESSVLSDFLALVREEDRDRLRALLDTESRLEMASPIELRFTRKDGGEIALQVQSVPVEYEGKPAVGVILSERGRERSSLERRLQAEKLAALEQLVSGIAHELNNPLTSVLGYAELLLAHEPLSESARHDLQTIIEQAQRAKKVIQNLLAFARFYRPEKITIDVNDVLRAALDAYRARTPSSPLRVILNLAPDLPRIWADRNLLEQVFFNIILNAEHAVQQARGHGTLLVETRMKRSGGEGSPHEVLEIRFTDDGPGIPASHLSRIFDPFFTTKPPGVGTGLGLSICHGIIKEHGGEIYALSEEGHGATFVIELPVSPAGRARESIPTNHSPHLR